jgi:hypothetical protein
MLNVIKCILVSKYNSNYADYGLILIKNI